MDVTIRQLGADDAAAYRELRLQALQDVPAAFGGSYEEEKNRAEEVWSKILQDDIYFGAFLNGELVGAVGMYFCDAVKMKHTANMIAVYVDPKYRKHGIAKKLCLALLGEASQQGFIQIKLSAFQNEAALWLYRSIGFKTYGVDPKVIKVGDTFYDEELMVKEL